MGADPHWRDCYGDYPMDKALRNSELSFPTLPLRRNVSMPVADRKALYHAAAAAVNVSGEKAHQMSYDRFSLYAEPMAGRRYSYDLDWEAEGLQYMDGTVDKYLGHAEYLKDDDDFVDMDQAREDSVRACNDTAANALLLRKLNQAETEFTQVEAPPTSHVDGVLDEEVEDILSRWKDEEYEKRLQQGIPSTVV